MNLFRISLCFIALVCDSAFAALSVSDLKVTPVEPIGLAIDYKVSGAMEDDVKSRLCVTMARDSNTVYTARTLVGATNCVDGAHRVYWNTARDGISVARTNVNVTVLYFVRYCVIDLSKGASASSYPVTYLDTPPNGGFNTNEYKTTKMVLRRVDAGTFTMGDSQWSNNKPHKVTLTKSFYMGIFEVTQKQWELVMGTNVCSKTTYGKGDAYPVHFVSYNDIRGSTEGAKWPATSSVDATSFMGKLRAKTGIAFDLPTEAQWECACRAGTTTSYSYASASANNYVWYVSNSNSKSHVVGTKKANSWGFYDMHGNLYEWCLDWQDGTALSEGTDPVGASSGTGRELRGGSWNNAIESCTSSGRYSGDPSLSNACRGFRVCWIIP
jgi:formylglycine-generating enzyme required for sulfatase activity